MMCSRSFMFVTFLVIAATPAAAIKVRPRLGAPTYPAVYGPVIGPSVTKPAAITVDVVDPESASFTVSVGWYNTSPATTATLFRSVANGVYLPVIA